MELAQWNFSKARGISCEDCKTAHSITNKKPDCLGVCKWVPVSNDNVEFVEIIHKYSLMISNGFGGLDSAGLRFILDNEDIDNKDVFIEKMNIYFKSGMKIRDLESRGHK